MAGNRAKGVILLSILLIVALLAAIAVRMSTRHSLTVAQARHTLGAGLTLSYAIGAETLARQLLFRDWEEDPGPNKSDHLGDAWAQPIAPFELDEYNDAFIEMQVRDLSSCFNLNALAVADATAAAQNVDRLKTLLRNLSLPDTIADTWRDWVDPDDIVSGFGGAETSDYQLLELPYRTPNRYSADISELQQLANIEPEQLALLLPHVCTLPTETLKVNVNTASAEVLSSLNPALTPETLLPLVNSERRYTAIDEAVAEVPDLQAGGIDALGVNSQYFELRAQVQIDGNVTEISSILHRDESNGELRLISRDLGKPFVSLYQDETE